MFKNNFYASDGLFKDFTLIRENKFNFNDLIENELAYYRLFLLFLYKYLNILKIVI